MRYKRLEDREATNKLNSLKGEGTPLATRTDATAAGTGAAGSYGATVQFPISRNLPHSSARGNPTLLACCFCDGVCVHWVGWGTDAAAAFAWNGIVQAKRMGFSRVSTST